MTACFIRTSLGDSYADVTGECKEAQFQVEDVESFVVSDDEYILMCAATCGISKLPYQIVKVSTLHYNLAFVTSV